MESLKLITVQFATIHRSQGENETSIVVNVNRVFPARPFGGIAVYSKKIVCLDGHCPKISKEWK